jgi:penicillin-binding protein 2
MGIDLMNEYGSAYGFGQHTGIELREEIGILAGPAYRDENGLPHWSAGNTISAAIGQSDNSVTPIQLASYIATVLNGGTRYSAHLLKEVREYGSGNTVYQSTPEILNTVKLSDDALSAAKTGMRRMITGSPTLTGYMSDVPVAVGGKTGTAQRGGNKLDNGLFVCAAPYNDPEIVVSSVIESSGSGALSTYAASRVLAEYYNK